MPLRIRCLPTPQPAGHCGGSSAQIIRPAFVGLSITNMGATLLPMISRNLQNAMLIPEQIQTQRFNNSMTLLQAIVSGLGSSSSGTSAGPGLGYVGAARLWITLGRGSASRSQEPFRSSQVRQRRLVEHVLGPDGNGLTVGAPSLNSLSSLTYL